VTGPATGDTRAEQTALSRAPATRFALRWLGYDRAQVDGVIQQLVAERQRLHARLVAAEALESTRHHEQAGDIVTLARRHADEIRTAAEHEAHQLLHEAEQRASLRESEQTEALSRDRDRIASLHRDIEWCLATVGTALDHVR